VQWHHRWKKQAYRGQVGERLKKKNAFGEAHPQRPRFTSNHTHYSTTDRDARVAVKPGKLRGLNYLGQLSVDTAHHVITGAQADYADKKDCQCLPSLLAQTIDNLKGQGLKVREVLADAAYSSPEALKALQQNKITGYIPNFGLYKPTREGFRYFPGGNYYKCSQGVKLPFKGIKPSHGGAYQVRQYASSSTDCRRCPVRESCIGKSAFKKIQDTVDKYLYDEMHERMQTPKAHRMKKLRQATAEPVLGTLINFLGMRRVNTRGIKLANKCFLMAATCYNLKRLLKWIGETEPKREKTLFQTFFTLWLFGVQGGRKIQLRAVIIR
jgi:hypothetical protein